MKKHDTNRKDNARRSTLVRTPIPAPMGFAAVIGSVEKLKNPEFWR